jgi:inositol transporter-like SP family MFS transporter
MQPSWSRLTATTSWRTTVLAALASYIDAGSIVAGAAGLALWAHRYGLSDHAVGLIGAFSSNGISAGVGALAGGWLSDRFGRRRVFRWDLLLYVAGGLGVIAAGRLWQLVAAYALLGLAVGIDVPASWTLIAETAPAGRLARRGGAAQLLWGLGPVVVLALALAVSGLGLTGVRIVFAHLVVVALVLWALRRRLPESAMWERAPRAPASALARRRWLAPLALLAGMYGLWNLKAGTSGFFLPYILRTVGAQSQAESVAVQVCGFLAGILATGLVFMRLADRASPRRLFAAAVALQTGGVLLLALAPLTVGISLAYVVLTGFGNGFGPQAFFQVWSAQSFPTPVRATALGLMFAGVRIALGVWSLFVPAITAAGFTTLAWLLTAFVVAAGALGLGFARAAPAAGFIGGARRAPG